MPSLYNRTDVADLEKVMATVVLPAFVEAYLKAEKDGYDVRNAFKSDIGELAARLEQQLQKAA